MSNRSVAVSDGSSEEVEVGVSWTVVAANVNCTGLKSCVSPGGINPLFGNCAGALRSHRLGRIHPYVRSCSWQT